MKSQTRDYTTLWSRTSGASGEKTGRWQKAYERLPQGYWRIIIEAKSGSGNERLAIAMDDLVIEACREDKGELSSTEIVIWRVKQNVMIARV